MRTSPRPTLRPRPKPGPRNRQMARAHHQRDRRTAHARRAARRGRSRDHPAHRHAAPCRDRQTASRTARRAPYAPCARRDRAPRPRSPCRAKRLLVIFVFVCRMHCCSFSYYREPLSMSNDISRCEFVKGYVRMNVEIVEDWLDRRQSPRRRRGTGLHESTWRLHGHRSAPMPVPHPHFASIASVGAGRRCLLSRVPQQQTAGYRPPPTNMCNPL